MDHWYNYSARNLSYERERAVRQGKVTNQTTHLGSDAETFWKRTAQETKQSSSSKQTVTLIASPCSSPLGNQTEISRKDVLVFNYAMQRSSLSERDVDTRCLYETQ